MSNISDDELTVLLQQLIDQTAPDRPSDAESQAVIRWAESARINAMMLEMVLIGDASVRIIDGQPSWKLTDKGMAAAEELMRQSPDARAQHDRLVADAVGKPLGKGPDDPQ
jgi:hypothetical protein